MSVPEINTKLQRIGDRVSSASLLGESVQQADLGYETSGVHNTAMSLGAALKGLEQGQGFSARTASAFTFMGDRIQELTDGSDRQDIVDARTGTAIVAANAEEIGARMSDMADKLQSALGHLAAFEADMEGYAELQKAAAANLETCQEGKATIMRSLDAFLENPL